MKKLVFFVFITCIGLYAHAQSKDEGMIKSAMDEQVNAWNAGDIDRYMNTYWHDDSLMFVGKNGITYGWENTLKNYKKGYPDTAAMGKLDFQLVYVKRLSDQYYTVVGKWHLKRSIGDLKGSFTLLFRKVKGQWMIIQDHSS